MNAGNDNKKKKILEESALPLSSTPMASSPFQTPPEDLAQTTTNSFEFLYYMTQTEDLYKYLAVYHKKEKKKLQSSYFIYNRQ